MHYFERLIRRAQAVPRNMPARLFDPFEQTVPWVIEPAVALAAARKPADPAAPAPTEAPPKGPNTTSSETTSPHLPRQTVSTVAPERVTEIRPAPSQPPVPDPTRTVERVLERHGDVLKSADSVVPSEGPLAKADAFMHSLNTPAATPKATLPDAVKPPRPEPAGERAVTAEPAPTTRQETAVARPTPQAQTVRPIPPRRSPPPETPSPRQPQPAPVAAAREERAPRRAVTTMTASEPAVTRTVLVAPSSRRPLDDLAQSSGISLFGIGQG